MVTVCMTCHVMFWNGARIGIVKTKKNVFCGAVLGSTIRSTCVLFTAATTIPRLPTKSAIFVVFQDQNNYHLGDKVIVCFTE